MLLKNSFAAAAVLAMAAPAAANLVVNGNFEAGNTGFTSGYTYVAPAPNAMVPEGLYTVDTSAFNSHPSWVDFGDNTTGSGNYLIVNGAQAPGTIVWEQTIAIAPGTNYFFEAFAAEICCNPTYTGQNFAANLTFEVTDNLSNVFVLDTFTTAGQTPGVWVGLSNTWNSGAATSATLRILNSSVDLGGNDFGIDDINFGTRSVIPEPATWALLISGFGLVGAAARRRRGQAVTA
jgi:hypothetical protein